MQIIVRNRQTLADIAVQVYGNIMAVVPIAECNSISVTDDLYAGQVIQCPEVEHSAKRGRYLGMGKISPATAISASEEHGRKIFTSEFTQEFV